MSLPARMSAHVAACLRTGMVVQFVAILALAAVSTPSGHATTAEERLSAVVGVRAEVPSDARTAGTLGTIRQGSGVVIDADGLIVTIGYLIMEASAVDVFDSFGRRVPADIVGYDHESGFGLLRAATIEATPAPLGESAALEAEDPVLVASRARDLDIAVASVASRRDFAGYWEYLLEDAIFTTPPHAQFGGAGLFGADARLVGIGSLFVRDAAGPGRVQLGNMFIPIDALKPIMGDLLAHGRRSDPPKPWLGITTSQRAGQLVVARVARGSPAQAAGLAAGDRIVRVGEERVRGLADLYRKIWSQGDAGVTVSLTVQRGRNLVELPVRSVDRHRWLRLDPTL